MDRTKIIKTALYGFGARNQIIKCIEEMSELQKELCKDLAHEGNRFSIAEEIADVEIMLEQIKLYYSCQAAIDAYTEKKLDRLAKRLNMYGFDD